MTQKVIGSVIDEIDGSMRMQCRDKTKYVSMEFSFIQKLRSDKARRHQKDQSVSVQRTRIRLKKTWVLNLVEIRKFQKPKPLRALIRERKFHGLRFYFYKP